MCFIFLFTVIGCVERISSREEIFQICDRGILEPSKRIEPTKSLEFYLKEKSQDEFFSENTYRWREAKAWFESIKSTADDSLIQCISKESKSTFLYIPNQYHLESAIGWEYIKFYLINNSRDTIRVSSYDSGVLNIKTEISAISNRKPQKWYDLQLPDSVFEDNIGFHERILLPDTFMEIQLENDYLGYGDSTCNYRIKLELEGKHIYSNPVPINFNDTQLKALHL